MILCLDPVFLSESKRLSLPFVLQSNDCSILPSASKSVRGIVLRLGVRADAAFLSAYERVRFIATITTGLDHIDLEYCEKHGVSVLSLKGETAFLESITATPEMTWALLLTLTRRIFPAIGAVRQGKWNRAAHVGTDLSGKILGIIGYGRVGKIVAQYAQAFRMKVLFFDPNVSGGERYLDGIFEKSDVIILSPEFNSETRGMIGEKEFQKMKKAPFLVNTSRGGILSESALIDALESGIVTAAAVDVLENEVYFDSGEAFGRMVEYAKSSERLLITPHIAGTTNEAMSKTARFIEEKIIRLYPEYAK